jgi:hypothetical protein
VPRISDEFLDCSFYTYDSAPSARAGEQYGATGFFVGVPREGSSGLPHTYAITNSHAIKTHVVIRLNTQAGDLDIVETERTDWVYHPDGDDVAALPITLDSKHSFRLVPISMLLTEEDVAKYRIGPGDEVFLVGRFISHDGRQTNLAAVRFGNISMLPHEPVEHPSGIKQSSFLVECRSLPGNSGSPVFLDAVPHQRNTVRTPGQVPPQKLLGIDWGHLPRHASVLERDRRTVVSEGWCVEVNSGMAGVVPAWKIKELLYCEEFRHQREQNER